MALHVEHVNLGAIHDRMFYKTARMMIAEVLGVSNEDSLVILYDSRTPVEIPRVYSGIATDLGAEVSIIEIPRPPSQEVYFLPLPKPVAAGLKSATKLITSWITYTDALAEPIQAGVHTMFIPPGPDVPDMLIRTVGEVDMKKMEMDQNKIAELWTKADLLTITSDLGTDLKADISGIEARHSKYPPSKPEKGKIWSTMTPWGTAGGGINSIEGTLVINGILGHRGPGLYGLPSEPITMEIKDFRIVKVKGDSKIWPLLKGYLDSFNDPNCYGFPAHGPAVGLNPNCRVGGPAEWERLRGCITFGAGDNSVMSKYSRRAPSARRRARRPLIKAKMHWDLQVLGATLCLDGKGIVENGEVKI